MDSMSVLQDSLKNEMELFRSRLSSIAIVDIGTIVSVNESGRALVHGSSFIGGEQLKYQDAEVIFPGNNAGSYKVECSNTPCLIFLPCSCMLDTTSKDVRFTAMPFDKAGVKVMPISNGTQDVVKMMQTSSGSISINTPDYSISIDPSVVSVETINNNASVTLDKQGIHVLKQSDNGTYYKDLVDGSASETWISKDKDVQWVDTFNQDGSRSFVQSDPRDSQGEPLFSITIDKEGVASLALKKGLTLETKDALTLKGKSVTVESTDGDINVTAKKDQSGPGKVTITADDNVDVKAGTGKKFTANGTNLEVE